MGSVVRRWASAGVVAVLALAGVVVVRAYDDGGGDDASVEAVAPREELVRSGPMTPEKAELLGEPVDFGPGCDTSTGRIELPTVYAPPCVEPFEGDNGGATSPGVTADTVKLVVYFEDLGALAQSAVSGAGYDLDRQQRVDTVDGFVDLYNQVFEAYGRRVEVEYYDATGTQNDSPAARADAIAIAEREPFAVIGGPSQASPVFADELAARGVLCLEGCAVGLPESFLDEHAPYVWMGSPILWGELTAEAVAKLAGPGKAEMAGSREFRRQDRVYAAVHYDTPDGLNRASFEDFRSALSAEGIELATDVEFFLDPGRLQESARTIVNQLEQAGVTTVIVQSDPLTPAALTEEATAQDYFPEWILGNNYLADTEQFARTYDPAQWGNGFAVTTGDAAPDGLDVWDELYRWAYGTPPPSNVVGSLEPPLRALFTGIHLAGPDLTPETFRDGLHRYPPSGGGPTRPTLYWADDRHGDVTLMWWDPEAVGVDETGERGPGMYRYADGGRRYRLGQMPDAPEDAGLFEDQSSITDYAELPPEDRAPPYQPPQLLGP